MIKFDKFVEAVKDEKTKVVMSLSSGGFRWIFHVVLIEFLEEMFSSSSEAKDDPEGRSDATFRDYVKELWGTSGGSIVAGAYASGMTPEEMMELFGSSKISLTASMSDILKVALGGKALGFSSIDSVERTLRKTFDGRAPQIPFYGVATNMDSLHREVLTLDKGGSYYRPITVLDDMVKIMAASSAVSILFSPLEINSKKYSDGQTVEPLPGRSIYEKWRIDKEIGIEESERLFIIGNNLGYSGAYAGERKNLVEITMKTFDVYAHELRKAQFALLSKERDVEILKFDPGVYSDASLESVSPLDLDKARSNYFDTLKEFNRRLGLPM